VTLAANNPAIPFSVVSCFIFIQLDPFVKYLAGISILPYTYMQVWVYNCLYIYYYVLDMPVYICSMHILPIYVVHIIPYRVIVDVGCFVVVILTLYYTFLYFVLNIT